jgi:hypothetical protein
MFLSDKDISAAAGALTAKHGAKEKGRIEQGVRQASRFWTPADGSPEEFSKFCEMAFVPAGPELDALFARFEAKYEQIFGHLIELSRQLRLELDEDRGPLLPVDEIFAAFNLADHLDEDLFRNKLAFIVLLNFPQKPLAAALKEGAKWSRRQWAEIRLANGFLSRVPTAVNQAISDAMTASDSHVSGLNVMMDHVVGDDGKPVFRPGLKLLSHWGLRDELKALYVDPAKNLSQQQLIQTIMERIVNQDLPQGVLDNPKVNWNPVANTVDGKPGTREPDSRFATLLKVFQAIRQADPFYPTLPSHMDRRFQRDRQIPEAEVQAMLESVLKAPAGKQVAALIEKRLGRKLQAFDIWYDGFKARGAIPEEQLDKIVREKYPTLAAFQKDIPVILGKLGFDAATAAFLGEHIMVDPARGSGHAWGPYMRTEKAHLRTRVPREGMNYKGFNIAMHELGHNVEQVFSLYRVDHTLLQGVPNTAFTEAMAFVFQARDLEVLGLSKPDPKAEASKALDDFWATREIAGVGLVDMKVWRWMYEHPAATPAELRAAVGTIAKEVWNTFYAPVLSVKDTPLLAIYSHMINNALYLPDYPVGHLIAFQVEDYFKSHPLGKEMERLCAQGNLTPNQWMVGAVGKPLSSDPLLKAASKALAVVQK